MRYGVTDKTNPILFDPHNLHKRNNNNQTGKTPRHA